MSGGPIFIEDKFSGVCEVVGLHCGTIRGSNTQSGGTLMIPEMIDCIEGWKKVVQLK